MILAGRRFYDARSDPAGGTAAWTLDDLCELAAAIGDPYGGRLAGGPQLRPGLGRGATDRLGAHMFCNDGMGNMALRIPEAIRVVRPSAMGFGPMSPLR